MAHQILRLSESTFDHENVFMVNVGKRYPRECSLHMGKEKSDDGILWVLMHSSCLKGSYTQADRDHQARLNAMTPIKNDDIVQVGRNLYKVKVAGDYSDCAVLHYHAHA